MTEVNVLIISVLIFIRITPFALDGKHIEYKFKIALIGDYASGKSCLYRRMIEGAVR